MTYSSVKSPSIIYLSILYIVAWCISPPLCIGTIYRVIAIAAVGILIFNSSDNKYPDLKKRLLRSIFIIAYMAILCLVTGDLFNRQIITYSILLVGAGFAMWNKRYGYDVKQLETIILFALVLYSIWNTTTIMALSAFPTVMRLLTGGGGEVDNSYFLRGVGNFGYLYSVIVMLPIGIYQLLESKRKLIKIVALYFVVSAYIMAYMSQFFTALILAMMAMPIMVVANKYRQGMNPIVIFFFFGVLFFLFTNLETILDFFH